MLQFLQRSAVPTAEDSHATAFLGGCGNLGASCGDNQTAGCATSYSNLMDAVNAYFAGQLTSRNIGVYA